MDLFFNILNNTQLHNLYGPTEAAVDVTCWTCIKQGSDIIPIGKPISNTQIYILNHQLQLASPYVRGEICIGGRCLAKGYLNRADITQKKFIKNPFSNNRNLLLYKTGDIGYWLPDGNLQYVGRFDNQVKMRGYRIELEEIENILNKCPGIKNAAVLIKKKQALLL